MKQRREIADHKIHHTDPLTLTTDDAYPGVKYVVTGMNHDANPATGNGNHVDSLTVLFQNGPIPVNGVNGVTNEVLISILIDRLQSFQRGSNRCKENACAITKLEEARMWLQSRTMDRRRRQVEGTTRR